MARNFQCWSCGASLKEVPRPIRRFTLCPECRADLHVCVLCQHYDRHYIGECSHDRADRVLDKTKANYCTYYVPRPDAYAGAGSEPDAASREALASLFGLGEGAGEVPAREPAKERDRARDELEALFNLKKDEDG